MSEEQTIAQPLCPECNAPVSRGGFLCERCAEAEDPGCMCGDNECPDCAGDRCSWCGGSGRDECPDAMECLHSHDALGECACRACDGRGHSQSIW